MSILIDDDGAVRTVILNRPDVRNAIDIPLRLELADALESAHTDTGVRAIVLTGAGSTFCSGGDISTMKVMSESEAMERAQLAQRVIRAIWNTPKPVIAAVEGAAFGAGAALAAACDRVVAGRDARFATTFTNVGLAGDMGAFASLPRRVGPARARQMLLFPRPFTADVAESWGLVDATTEPGSALAAAQSDAQQLAAGPAQAYGVIKTLLAISPALPPMEVLDHEAAHQARLFGSDDFAEGITAFREKRRPSFGPRQGVVS
ncbi:enoyl-CoA hydratase [Mycobacterium sp. 852013-50091_SCH5140682]|uniref:enoyl-CoA hydratase/isomerase family protein n=1 Tax=Mycobacterium sp. 852013-50091_SCH5140682 TaxID=1834109 RepID=UPI0007EA5294|nr:enoyl-CoA hydratase-related protein [Mycobacterium sp. 852013-50091_SCH5140682]OBC11992.1 enoyl-CoA hydratase [Mycobacterium sp. 852013-50091_SCH5140682]